MLALVGRFKEAYTHHHYVDTDRAELSLAVKKTASFNASISELNAVHV